MRSRKSFTLIEVMIVLMIVVSFFAIAWPRMRRLAGKTEIRQAALDFQTACRTARDQAVRRGTATQIRFQWGQSNYHLTEPSMPSDSIGVDTSTDNRLTMATDLNVSTGATGDSTAGYGVAYQSYELPVGIAFANPDVHPGVDGWSGDPMDDLRDDSLGGITNSDKLADEDFIQIGPLDSTDRTEDESINFYPDGRSDSATLRLMALDTGDSILLQLRGLTGELSIGDIAKRLDFADEF